jgi:hypothetical protein
MRSFLRLACGLAALLPARTAPAATTSDVVGQPPAAMKGTGLVFTFGRRMWKPGDPASDIDVDLVVDVTEDGAGVARPTPDHPVYYYPVTRGYTLGQGVVPGEPPPPPTAAVQHLLAVALAGQGYRVATRQTPPSLILMFWWGYKAPVTDDAMNGGAAMLASANGGGVGNQPGDQTAAINQAASAGLLPAPGMANQAEMEELVAGSSRELDNNQKDPSLRSQALIDASRIPRYYVTVSALDYAAATQEKKPVVLWTARMSTELYGHTLAEVLPTLIAQGAPQFGTDTNGAVWPFPTVTLVPAGRVQVGTPYLKSYSNPPELPRGE